MTAQPIRPVDAASRYDGPPLKWEVGQGRAGRRYQKAKRVLDLVAAAAVVTAASPVMVVLAVWVRSEDDGPALYRGLRVGLNGQPFLMYKFRTMVIEADRIGGPSTANDDPRLTRVGTFLRRWKLDELPQFLNVIRGEMSIVGPRPQVVEDVARYTEDDRRLLSVRPGITDWASIRFRDEGAILEGLDPDEGYDRLIRGEKLALGLHYVETASLRTDLRIVVETAKCLVGREPVLPNLVSAGRTCPRREDE